MKNKIYLVLITALLLIVTNSCGVYETLENFARVKFKVDSYNNFRLADVSLADKKDIKDFTAMEYVRLTGAFVKGELPFSFLVNIEAKNPNDGTGGFPATDLSIQSFPFRVIIEDKEVLTGNIDEAFIVPGVGENKIIPISVQFDVLKFFKDKSFEDVANLILAIGGKNGSESKITIKAQPVIGTPVGNIKYPNEITIDHDFN